MYQYTARSRGIRGGRDNVELVVGPGLSTSDKPSRCFHVVARRARLSMQSSWNGVKCILSDSEITDPSVSCVRQACSSTRGPSSLSSKLFIPMPRLHPESQVLVLLPPHTQSHTVSKPPCVYLDRPPFSPCRVQTAQQAPTSEAPLLENTISTRPCHGTLAVNW